MDIRQEITPLTSALLSPYEQRMEWPDAAQGTTDRLFAIIVGMYMPTTWRATNSAA